MYNTLAVQAEEPMIAKGSGSISYHFHHLLALLNVNYENYPLLLVTVKNGGITTVKNGGITGSACLISDIADWVIEI